MEEMLTREEMEARYPGEWVFVGDPEVDTHLEVMCGTVLAHSTQRDELYQKALTLRPKRSAYLFFDTVPNDFVVIL